MTDNQTGRIGRQTIIGRQADRIGRRAGRQRAELAGNGQVSRQTELAGKQAGRQNYKGGKIGR